MSLGDGCAHWRGRLSVVREDRLIVLELAAPSVSLGLAPAVELVQVLDWLAADVKR